MFVGIIQVEDLSAGGGIEYGKHEGNGITIQKQQTYKFE